MGERQFGIDPVVLKSFASEVAEIHNHGVQIGIVIGGGNIFRGIQAAEGGMGEARSRPEEASEPSVHPGGRTRPASR